MRNTWHRSILLATAFAAVGCSSDSQAPTQSGNTGGSKTSSQTSSTDKTGGSTGQSAGGSSATSTTKTQGNGGSGTSSSDNQPASGGSSSQSSSKASSPTGGAATSGSSKPVGGGSSVSTPKTGGAGPGAGGAATTPTPTAGRSSGGGGRGPGAAGAQARGGAPADGGAPAEGGAPVAGTSSVVQPTGLAVNLDKTRQTIQGFGINTALSDKNIPISTMFSTTGADGIGLSILRVGMNSSGNLTGTGISDARKADPNAKIIASVWSAPADCKSNKKLEDGGYLLDTGTCMADWATKIANFAKAQNLYAMSVANESDFASCPGNPVCTSSYETMTYTAKQMVAWVKVAGKKIREVSPNTKVIAPEASEWIHAWSNLSGTGSIVASHPDSSDPHKCGCFSNTITPEKEATCAKTCLDGNGYDYGHWLWKDQEAWKSFDILGVHEYDSQIAFAWPADVNDGKRDKEVWQTEMSGVMHWPEQGPSTDINNGVAVAGWIHSALTIGEASAWLYWWYQAYYEDDNEGLALTKSGTTIAKRYYTMGNYSKFVRPGYLAVEVTGNNSQDVLLSAYKSADSKTVVIVAINKGSAEAKPEIGFGGGTAPASCTPTVTSATENLKDGTAVTVTGGVLKASLASKTVTTYVCK